MTLEQPTTELQLPDHDPGITGVFELPGSLIAKKVPTPAGDRVMLTIRYGTTTLTMLLPKDDADTWGRKIVAEAAGCSSLLVTSTLGGIASPNGSPQRF